MTNKQGTNYDFLFCKYRTQLAGMWSRVFDRSCVFGEGAAEKSVAQDDVIL